MVLTITTMIIRAHNNDNDDGGDNNDNDDGTHSYVNDGGGLYHDDHYLRRGGSCSRRPARPGRAVDAAFWRPGNCGKFLM